MLRIAIIGHINLKESYLSFYEKKVHEMLKSLQKKHKNIIVYSSLADGADRLVVEVALGLGIGYSVVLPMEKELYMLDFDAVSQVAFTRLLKGAVNVMTMPPTKSVYNRTLQYEMAGRYISDNCDVLMALWDGKYINLQGGTSETVKYHCKKSGFRLYHLPVSRSGDLSNHRLEFIVYEEK
jgi:hypothetical protein